MNNQQKRIQQTMDLLGVLLIILAVHFVVGAFNGKWPWSGNAYNSYLLQAESWLQGRLDLGQNYEYLELEWSYKNKHFKSLCVVSNEHGGFIYDPIGSNILEYTTTTTNTVERLNSKENLH